MDDARTTLKMDLPATSRARRVEKAVVAEYIHELSERHRPSPNGRPSGDSSPQAPDSGSD
jgi:hypothetical protein